MTPIYKRKRNLPKPGVTVKILEATTPPPLPKPEPKVHPLLLKPYEELKLHERLKLDIYHEFEGNISLNDIFVDSQNGVILYRTERGGWVSNPAYMEGGGQNEPTYIQPMA